jgi:spore coat protein U-like protein
MNINIFQWRYSLFLILIAVWLLPINNAQAALTVTCQAGMNTAPGGAGIVNFGTITPANANTESISGTLNYSCTNTGTTAGYVSVCLAVDGGEYNNTAVDARYMQRAGSATNNRLNFTMTLPGGTLWSTRGKTGSEFNSGSLEIRENSTITGSVPINISMNGGNTNATQGSYTNNFGNGNHTALTFLTSTTSPAPNCNGSRVNQQSIRFPFIVQAAVLPVCTITATSDVNLGARSASDTNITGSNSSAITVQCTNGGSYYIGLQPSNDSQNGAGVMSGTGGNLDKVLYQLRSTAGMNGEIWGNTATSTTKGNGVADFGTGSPKAQTVYVTVPRADFKPDSYSDTVTIKVSY